MRLPLSLFGSTVGLCLAAAWLQRSELDLVGIGTIGLWLALLSAVAALIAAKQRSNPVGWLLLVTALLIAAGAFATSLAQYFLENSPDSELAQWAGWVSLWVGTPGAGLFVLSLLLFPNGILLSNRWRFAVGLTIFTTACMTVGYAVKPGAIDNLPGIKNHLTFEGAQLFYELADGVFSMMMVGAGLAALTSLLIRMRRSRDLERQQLKWFVYAVALFPFWFAAAVAADAILDAQLGAGDHYVDFFLIMIGAALIPLAMGVSILRYRLYEIDLIINRTLVYALLTAILAGVYLTIVVTLQQIVALVATDSDLAIAASTLVVAALFRPLRSRIQGFIDQRFYRRKYDAAATLDDFAAKLRDEVDLESLSEELVGVVGTTMQPRHISLWLRTS